MYVTSTSPKCFDQCLHLQSKRLASEHRASRKKSPCRQGSHTRGLRKEPPALAGFLSLQSQQTVLSPTQPRLADIAAEISAPTGRSKCCDLHGLCLPWGRREERTHTHPCIPKLTEESTSEADPEFTSVLIHNQASFTQ